MDYNSSGKQLPQVVLFGDSLTEWSFDDSTQGFGWYLTDWYKGKAEIVNEGTTELLSCTPIDKAPLINPLDLLTVNIRLRRVKLTTPSLHISTNQFPSFTSEHVKREFSRLITQITAPYAPPTLLFTIFLGANDACFVGKTEYVPLPQFSDNIRSFVEEILTQDNLADAKIVLITPPPINVPEPFPSDDEDLGPAMAKALKGKDPKQDRGYMTYMSKKRYAEGIMSIAREYEGTGRVVGLDYWSALVNAGLADQGRPAEVDEDKFPGCGLSGAKEFGGGWFTDGLHLDKKAYNVLSRVLTETVIGKWPELSPERIGT
ncbi:SGNH hydrolase [Karstenula rhodostoma CBS 690.94]|uniref:SGNH hydrolase n=1 Tax=Karstenula rhodostoma CBS 690.94 TaxID=1392251 RepID=A0A9P4UIR2_9PLEO|nr:SGNH hydrolase [Karstenula rhodostoma CBS 690.94]